MSKKFEGCNSLTTLDISKFNTKEVKDMNGMFKNCKKLLFLDVKNFDTNNVRDFAEMFYFVRNYLH